MSDAGRDGDEAAQGTVESGTMAARPSAQNGTTAGAPTDQRISSAQIETITRTVLAVLAAREEGSEKTPRSPWLVGFEFLSSHWAVIAFLLAVLGILVASITDGLSPLYPFKELAFKQRELTHKERAFAHKEADFEKAVFEKQEASRLVAFARTYLDVEQFAEAKQVYKQALDLDPTNTLARAGLLKADVYALATAGQYDPEVVSKRLEFLLQQDPDDPHAHTALGNVYASIDQEKARAHYEHALHDPTVAGARFGLGQLLLQEAGVDAALPHLEQAVALSPWNLRYVEMLAYAQRHSGNMAEAVNHYERALRLDPSYLSPAFEYALVLREVGRLREAAGHQQRLLALLGDSEVMGHEKNKTELWFPTDKGADVTLRDIAEKRCYVLYSLAATLHLLGDERAAVAYATEAEALTIAILVQVKALVASDMTRLVARQPAFKRKEAEFTRTFLVQK